MVHLRLLQVVEEEDLVEILTVIMEQQEQQELDLAVVETLDTLPQEVKVPEHRLEQILEEMDMMQVDKAVVEVAVLLLLDLLEVLPV
jgi:hypothetical protein